MKTLSNSKHLDMFCQLFKQWHFISSILIMEVGMDLRTKHTYRLFLQLQQDMSTGPNVLYQLCSTFVRGWGEWPLRAADTNYGQETREAANQATFGSQRRCQHVHVTVIHLIFSSLLSTSDWENVIWGRKMYTYLSRIWKVMISILITTGQTLKTTQQSWVQAKGRKTTF